ncbi:caspase family protein [Brevibacillus centrosporus]|uniref:caspase family protein n=1 Tax=Brevibacillus centrosporus TaxID=54910 RepID=UPI003B029B0A
MKRALVIGLNNYPGAELQACINDAKEVSAIIERNQDGTPNFAVKLVTDEHQTIDKAILKKLIKELFDGDDTVLLYFAGHGIVNAIGGYIVTPDFQDYDEGISMDEILVLANKSNARNKIIILDCCHSGKMGSHDLGKADASQIGQGMTILTSCKSSEAAIEQSGRGVFTSLLLEALQGGAADLTGNVTPGSIYWFVDKALGPWDQRPVFKTNVSAYVSIRSVNPPIALEVLRRITTYFDTPYHEIQLNPTFEDSEKETAILENVKVFKDLQKLVSVGVVKPVGEEHMYYAAMNSRSCKLTTLGQCYWRFVSEGRL